MGLEYGQNSVNPLTAAKIGHCSDRSDREPCVPDL